jgi:hypothetical protein
MKTKGYVILGTAVAIYLLWKNSKNKKTTTSTTIEGVEVTTGGGVTGGGTTTMPTSNEPEQIFGASLPTGMDLPVLTAGTGVPTEVGVQEGLGNTTPIPVLAPIKEVSTEDILVMSGITPIVKDTTPQVLDIPQVPIIPKPQPMEYSTSSPMPKDEVKIELRSECGNSFSVPNFDKESSYVNFWFDGNAYFLQNTSSLVKSVPVKITEQEFLDACKKLKQIKMQITKE